jgi:hypothetical protein
MYLTICAIVSLVHLCYVALARRAGRYFKPGRRRAPVGRITGGLNSSPERRHPAQWSSLIPVPHRADIIAPSAPLGRRGSGYR